MKCKKTNSITINYISIGDAVRSILALVTLVILIPTLLTLGNGPTFFVAQGLNAFGIIFVVLIVVVIPIIFFSIPILAIRLLGLQDKIVSIAAGSLIGFLATILTLQDLPSNLSIAVSLFLSVCAGILFAFLFIINNQVRRFFRELGPIILIVTLVWFFFISPASGLFQFGSGKNDFISNVKRPVPLTIIVFDEFHLAALLDRNGSIDAVRFPNFAKLANDGVWFPNAIANATTTIRSIPGILSGKYAPDGAPPPIVSNYPKNLLNTFSRVYTVTAQEPVTGLCPGYACSDKPVVKLSTVFKDIRTIALKSILPAFIASNFPTIDGRWTGFTESINPSLQQEKNDSLDSVLSKIGMNQESKLNFLHFVTPHLPYVTLNDGRKYEQEDYFPAGIVDKQSWTGDDILIETAYHRYLHQVAYADFLLGKILNKLDSAGHYFDSIIIVTSDHGVAFVGGENRRLAKLSGNLKEVHQVPFFIKLPSSSNLAQPGTVNLSLVSHLDIVPSIAQVLGVELPYDVQGDSLFKLPKSNTRKIPTDNGIVSSPEDIKGFDRLAWQIERFGDNTTLSVMTRIDGIPGSLIGQPLHKFDVRKPINPLKASLVAGPFGLWAMPNAFESFLPARVQGSIDGGGGPYKVVLALNGVISAITQTSIWGGNKNYFEAMLPPANFSTQGNKLEIFLTNTGSKGNVSLIPVNIRQSKTFEIGIKKH